MTVDDAYKWLDSFAPFETQEEYDNAGFLVGSPNQEVRKVFFALDATLPAVSEAADWGADLMITHHPLMFQPVQQLCYERSEGATLKALAVSGISLIAAHTNLDMCAGGVADSLAEALSLEQIKPSGECQYLRTGTLAAPCTANEFLAIVNRSLNTCARLYGNPDAHIQSVSVMPGASGSKQVHAGTDAFVTGEIHHYELLDAVHRGLTVFDAGHYPTEFPGVAALHQRFVKAAAQNGWAVEARLYTTPPYTCTVNG